MPRGGRRAGTPGAAYSNRSDLNRSRTLPAKVAPGQTYGAAGAQLAAQQIIPMATPSAPSPADLQGAAQPAGPPPPRPDFGRPTDRPDEPVTAGLSTGPGAGPEALGLAPPPPTMPQPNPTHEQLRALYQQYPNDDLRELLEDIDTGVF